MMKKETFNEAMGWLEKFHTKPISDHAKEVWWKEFKGVPDEIFCKAIMASYQTARAGSFPSISEIKKIVTITRERDAAAKKNSFPKYPIYRGPPQPTEMGRVAMDLLRRKDLPPNDPEKLDAHQIATTMIVDLEIEYPGKGWRECGEELLADLQRMKEGENVQREKEIRRLSGKDIR